MAPSGSGTLPPSEGPTASVNFTNKARVVMASFPEVTQVVSQTGRPDDGTDTAGFFNTEYFVDLKPKKEWRPLFHQDKEALIAAIDQQLSKFPGVIWNYSQPISDNMEEAVSGVKGELAVKLYGDDLRTLAAHSRDHPVADGHGERRCRPRHLPHRRPAQSKLCCRSQGHGTLGSQRGRCAGCDSDCRGRECRHPGAAGRSALRRNASLSEGISRHAPGDREYPSLVAPSGERISLGQLTTMSTDDGAEAINREGGQRYIAIKFSVEGRDLGSTVKEAINRVENNVKLPTGHHLEWAGEYASQQRANKRMAIVIPITVLAIFLILYTMFRSAKWAMMILRGSSWPILRSGTWCRGSGKWRAL